MFSNINTPNKAMPERSLTQQRSKVKLLNNIVKDQLQKIDNKIRRSFDIN
jgi:hypothetical protein